MIGDSDYIPKLEAYIEEQYEALRLYKLKLHVNQIKAKEMLDIQAERVHTFKNAPWGLVGCDWDLDDVHIATKHKENVKL